MLRPPLHQPIVVADTAVTAVHDLRVAEYERSDRVSGRYALRCNGIVKDGEAEMTRANERVAAAAGEEETKDDRLPI